MSKRGELTPDRIQMLAHLACASRPNGSSTWDEAGVVPRIRDLMARGFGIQEVIDRVLAHAWDASAKTPGTILTPKNRTAVESNPVPYPMTRAEECRLHPGEQPGVCRACAADRLVDDSTPYRPRKEDPPAYDGDGKPLHHTPLRDLVNDHGGLARPSTEGAEV